jgi:hypothetical protein
MIPFLITSSFPQHTAAVMHILMGVMASYKCILMGLQLMCPHGVAYNCILMGLFWLHSIETLRIFGLFYYALSCTKFFPCLDW